MDELIENKLAFNGKKPVTFRTLRSSISLGFRAFVNKPRIKNPTDQLPAANITLNQGLDFYIAGTFGMSHNGEPCAGGGVWLSANHPKNRAVGVPDNLITRTSGELSSILYVIQNTPRNIILNFILQSKHTVHKLTLGLPQLESNGWPNEQDKVLLMTIVATLRIRGTRTTFRQSEGGHERLNFKSAQDLAHAAMSNDPDEYIVDPDTLFTRTRC